MAEGKLIAMKFNGKPFYIADDTISDNVKRAMRIENRRRRRFIMARALNPDRFLARSLWWSTLVKIDDWNGRRAPAGVLFP